MSSGGRVGGGEGVSVRHGTTVLVIFTVQDITGI